ncbi:hypothetical protein AB1Y20_006724 [Prymnesium parvum]|uniref:F5/8 type C domain-containing protein n=1 Tax=Prymnesium parvum TaxID=97485 RepID=A0AB34J0H9_PRYPA
MSDTLDSSNWAGHTFGASRCIDGVYGLGNARWSFCNSNLNQNNPWLSVQYASGSYIDSVSIYTRSDCCQRFLSQFEVYVGSSAGNPLSSGSMTRQRPDARCGRADFNWIGVVLAIAQSDVGPYERPDHRSDARANLSSYTSSL